MAQKTFPKRPPSPEEEATVSHIVDSLVAWDPASQESPYVAAARYANQKREPGAAFCNQARAQAIAQLGLATVCGRNAALRGRYSPKQLAQAAEALKRFDQSHWAAREREALAADRDARLSAGQ